jgi:hypothetical protein
LGKSNGETKKKILGLIFAEKLVLENGNVVEPVFTKAVMLTFKIENSIREKPEGNTLNTF